MKRLIILLLFFVFIINVNAQSVTFNGTIPEITLENGINKNVVDLTSYFNGSNLTYKFKAGKKGLDGVDVSINKDGKVDMIPRSKPTKSIIFLADDDFDVAESNEVNIIINADIIAITFSPNTDSLQLTKGESYNFAVNGANEVMWYLNDVLVNPNSSSYRFSNDEVKLYNLKVVADNFTKAWIVSVLAPNVTIVDVPEPQIIEPVCGNNIREQDEDCSSCPADVKCAGNAQCADGECVIQEESPTRLILWLVLLVAGIVFVVFAVVLVHKKGLLKKKIIIPEETEIEPVEDPNKDILPLIDYLKTNLKTFNKDVLIEESLRQGWTQEQIDRALKIFGDNNEGDNRENKEIN